MSKMLVGILAVVVLFGISAGASWMLQQGKVGKEGEESGEAGAERPGKSRQAAAAAPAAAASSRPSLRPPYNPEAEGAAQLAANLRTQLDSVKAREQQLTTRQKHLELIYQDIRSERGAVDEVRKQVDAELKALEDKLHSLEQKSAEMSLHREKIADQTKELKQTVSQMEGIEQDRVKQVASMYDTMEPDSAAEILQTMVEEGKLDTAVKILSTMKERQAAKVLAQFPERTTVVQMLEKLKTLRRTPADSK